MLKSLMQNILVVYLTLGNKFYFFNFKFTKPKFLWNFFWYLATSLCTILFRADTGNIRKIGNLNILKKQEN